MIIVIDGYNLVKTILKVAILKRSDLIYYIVLFNSYAKAKRHYVMIVLDGGPYERPVEQKLSHGRVVYTGTHQSADEYIEQYSARKEPSSLMVVSSDRALQNNIKALGILVMNSSEFYGYVNDFLEQKTIFQQNKTPLTKVDPERNDELDELMKDVLLNGVKEEYFKDERIKKSTTSKKKDRMLLQKIKKL